MDSVEKFPWIPFYMNFADALLPYRNDRPKLLAKLRTVFSLPGISLDNPYSRQLLDDIDPFTIYVQFNRNISHKLRLTIIRALRGEFAVSGDMPSSFPGLPVLYSSPFIFYNNNLYSDRDRSNEKNKERDIESLWKIFSSALALTSQDTLQNREAFSAAFDQAHPQQNRWYLTTGLYWIRPYAFLSLQKRNRVFLEDNVHKLPFFRNTSRNIFKKFPAGHTYLTLCDDFKKFFSSGSSSWSSFPMLSQAALPPSYSSSEPAEMVVPSPTPLPQPSRVSEVAQVMKDDSYTREAFLKQTFLEAAEYDTLAETLEHKKNLILQGPPGVGKTYIARRLAWALAGAKDAERVRLVQFHQNTSYEDFIMGFRPDGNGFKLKEGIFHTFCQQAGKDKHNNYYLIIDEINRGNTSKIFGDMFMLLEKDKRGEENGIPLLYKPEENFSIPENLFIIGTMNTADRSLAMMDYALRRRFAFYDLKPAFSTKKFAEYVKNLESAKLDALIEVIRQLNAEISQDPALGEGFCIGHSYFSNWEKGKVPAVELRTVVEQELIPLVREYWYDDRAKAADWSDKLRAALQ